MADPITREQVERLLADMHEDHGMWHVIADALGEDWLSAVPMDVRLAWQRGEWGACIAALTRWRDELAAAEPVRRVARWDAALGHYVLTPPITSDYRATTDPYAAIAWGYEIEGGPASAPAEDSPERLRERREALGWSLEEAAEKARWHIDDIHALEGVCPVRTGVCGRCPLARVDYAAALSAEEERLAAKASPGLTGIPCGVRNAEPERPAPRLKVGDLDPVLRETARRTIALLPDLSARPLSGFGFNQLPGVDEWRSGKLTSAEWADQLGALLGAPASPPAPEVAPAPLPERPAPRFKVGDWVRVVSNGAVYQVGEVAIPFGGAYYFRETGGAENSWAAPALEPASPHAPEVVDVPQPITKRCSLDGADIYATWVMDGGVLDLLFVRDDGEHREPVPLALLRAMLEAIDAQQGGASRLRAAEARTAWQPIETVAVDETVLLWDPVRRGVRMGHVSIRRGCIYTHWMPLPAAPEAP